MNDDRWRKWHRWFEVIRNEIQHLCLNKYIFLELKQIINANENLHQPSAFYDFINSSYAAFSAVTVRKLVKGHKDSISFSGLLEEIIDTPDVLSKERFVALYSGSVAEQWAEKDFAPLADENGHHISHEMVIADLDELRALSGKIETFVDKEIAHTDKRRPRNIPTFNELHRCIEAIEALGLKYQMILTASHGDSMTPSIQGPWKRVFEVPWILPD